MMLRLWARPGPGTPMNMQHCAFLKETLLGRKPADRAVSTNVTFLCELNQSYERAVGTMAGIPLSWFFEASSPGCPARRIDR